ncbi:MAG: hypothetical protein FD143_1360 [Ignavibacteria bacterium]|nr:MAG: hypothetical protein FD143_1360 [Ignavibacteria bacterium]KAF0160666.1 MAG: hypothetical protein FD188_1573 [Ignavibacteria bacterium]
MCVNDSWFLCFCVTSFPNLTLPHYIVQTTYPNAIPEEVEKQIIKTSTILFV